MNPFRKPFTSLLTTRMIQAYCRAGKINRARELFDEMPGRNIISFSAMIYGYAINGHSAESFRLFSLMQDSGLRPNSFTVVALLLGAACTGSPRLGESVHGMIIKSRLETDSFVRTAMLDYYARCGHVNASYALFEEVDRRNLVTCNAMISGFVSNSRFKEALVVFKQLRAAGLSPNCITLLSITQSCAGYRLFSLCGSLHGYIVKVGFDLDVSVMNSVLEMYFVSGSLEIVYDFFSKMVLKDVITWTTMMSFLLELELAREAFDTFYQMRADGIEPDSVAMVNVITACALLGEREKGMMAHSQIIVRQFGSGLPISNSLIAMYSKCGDPETASTLFDRVQERSLVSWTAMISGYVQNGQPREALDLLIRMKKEENLNLDSITIVCSLAACSELASFVLCRQLHADSFKSALLPVVSVQNSLVAAYGKCGNLELAQKVFEEMVHRDVVSWNVMISACGINSKGAAAVAHFHSMNKYGQEPDSVTYLTILNACNHSGLVDDGLTIFEKMVKDRRIEPSGEHCGCLVDMLARAGRLADARNLVYSLRDKVSENAWKALLGGCYIHNELGLAEVAADKVMQMDSADSGHLVLLSNVYASEGKFDGVETLRRRLGNKGLVKTLGFSLLDGVPCDVG